MTLAVSIAGAIAVAITARLMYMFFLSGKRITNASFIGRIVTALWASLQNFAEGWRGQSLKYKFIAYPCMLLSMGLTSLLIYWLTPIVSEAAGFWNTLRYCVLIILVGVSASVIGAFLLIYLIFLLGALIHEWWTKQPDQETMPNEETKKEEA